MDVVFSHHAHNENNIIVGLLRVSQVCFSLKSEHTIYIILNWEATVSIEMMLRLQAGEPFVLLYIAHRTYRGYMKLGQQKLWPVKNYGFTTKINRICYHFHNTKILSFISPLGHNDFKKAIILHDSKQKLANWCNDVEMVGKESSNYIA